MEQLADLLIDKGFPEEEKSQILDSLSSIGYHRLSAYWYPFKDTQSSISPRPFKSGITFNTILRLYDFDCDLRILVMEAISRIEVALRAYWSQELKNNHSYTDYQLFKSSDNHAKHLAALKKELDDTKEPFVVHYRKKYCKPEYPPIWAIVEIMSFGTLFNWFENTNNDTKLKVANRFKIPDIHEKIQITESFFVVYRMFAIFVRIMVDCGIERFQNQHA